MIQIMRKNIEENNKKYFELCSTKFGTNNHDIYVVKNVEEVTYNEKDNSITMKIKQDVTNITRKINESISVVKQNQAEQLLKAIKESLGGENNG